MDLARHYFISDDLDDLERIEEELEAKGILTPQIHLLTRDNAGLHRRSHLHGVPSIMKRNMFAAGLAGAVVGLVLAGLALFIPMVAGWTTTAAGWAPFIYLAIILFGFCTWFGGMHGLRMPNHQFLRFQKQLDEGKHVLFVDLDQSQTDELEAVVERHPGLQSAGVGHSMPEWLVWLENRTRGWWYWRMWRNS